MPVQGEDWIKERTEDAVGDRGRGGLETAVPVKWKGHCLAEDIPEGLDHDVVPRLRGWTFPAIS
jgi:hypothetical protein